MSTGPQFTYTTGDARLEYLRNLIYRFVVEYLKSMVNVPCSNAETQSDAQQIWPMDRVFLVRATRQTIQPVHNLHN